VEAPPDVVQAAWEAAYGRVRKQARLPGFRRGHVPKNLVRLHFGDDVRREVAEHLIPEVYRQALAETRIEPIDEPDVRDVTLEEGAPLTFTAIVEVKPVITLGAYKGLAVQHAPTAVTDDEVEEAIGRMREQQVEYQAVSRPVDRGDLVLVDLTLAPEGLPPVVESGYAFVVGDGSVMPEVDAAVVGAVAGTERVVGVRFPADHRREDLRGRSGTARVKVVEVKEKVLPAVDDEFARSLGEFANLEAFRAEVRRQLDAQRERDNRRLLEERVVDALLARHEFSVPEAMVMRHMAQMVEHTRERLKRQGVDPDRLPWDYEKLTHELRPRAERAVRRALVLDAIAGTEGLTPGEADIDAEIARIAADTGRPVAAVRGMLEKRDDLEALRLRVQESRTLDFLIRQATVTS
jgi:trigger factor